MICVTGDGAFGINAMEIDTAVRHGAKAVFIVSNKRAWNIERYDQETTTAAASWARCSPTPTMPPWPAPSALTASGWRSPRTSTARSRGRWRTRRRSSTW